MAVGVRKAAVLGAGVMGSGIAAHLANAGVPTLLLDIVPRELTEEEKKRGLTTASKEFRNRFAISGLQKALAAKPAAFFSKVNAELITVGNFDDDLDKIADCDFVVEAVVENMDIKRSLFQRVARVRKGDCIVASNTSGLSLKGMSEGLPEDFRKHFLVTHFFNPVRYMKLLEIVTLPETDPEVVKRAAAIGEELLGKGIVWGKDTTNFVANRIGVFAMMDAIHLMVKEGYTIDEVDAIAGKPLGRPKSAAFRTADMVGLDTLLHVAKNCYDVLVHDEKRETFKAPPFIEAMVKQNMLGDKTGKGFYCKVKTPDGKSEIQTLDYNKMEYVPKQKVRFDSLGAARNIDDLRERIKAVVFAEDRAGQFAWKNISETLIYATHRIPEIADDIVQIDNAMKWGFNWELGPFELWDALGVEAVVERLKKEGRPVPKMVTDMLAAGQKSFYVRKDGASFHYDPPSRTVKPIPVAKEKITFQNLREQKKVIKENAGATLYDLGDGVLGLEFHTKMNSIDVDIIEMMHAALDEAEAHSYWHGLVITNDDTNFSVGANLMLVLMTARQKEFKPIEEMAKKFQDANMRARYGLKPVVVAPFGLTLGGGVEVTFGASRVVACSETYIGLVEAGAGVIPAAGGTREMTFRALEAIPPGVNANPMDFIQNAFVTVAMAKVATSAQEAQEMRYLRPTDRIVLARDRLTFEAKKTVLHLAEEGYKPPRKRTAKLPGPSGYATLRAALYSFRLANQVTDHDVTVASKLAFVMTGGNCSPNIPVDEQYLLDLEREAFLSLCGEEKTQARMEALLMTGKPLRN
jgi:3-hydroxyacyl-CoA dehydrogenase